MCSNCTIVTMEYQEALDWLYSQKKIQKRKDLSRIERCIHLLNIKTDYQIIHIAGTNGKGSVSSYLNSILKTAGKRVGMFVSPYVISFNERIEVDQEFIPDEKVITYIEQLQKFSAEYFQTYEDTIPFFELTFLMALLYFQEKRIEVLILECGLGGLLDATNVLDKDITVITNIGYDHVKELGPTLEDIAIHKLGITRKNIACITAVDESLLPLFKDYAREHDFPLVWIVPEVKNIQIIQNTTQFTYKKEAYQASLCGIFQGYNASLAVETIHQLFPKISTQIIQEGLRNTQWPGRLEQIRENVILDGAHNLPGIEALTQTMKQMYPNQKMKIVFTALRDKAISDMLACLDDITDEYYFTTIQDNRATDLDTLSQLTKCPYKVFLNYKEAIDSALLEMKENEVLLITGSLHFISEARSYLLGDQTNEL